MTNTIFGLLSVLFVITLIVLWGSCNRNNIKTETKVDNAVSDTLNQSTDSLSNSTFKDSTSAEITDSTKNEQLSLNVDTTANKVDEKEDQTNESEEKKLAADFKENRNKPTTQSSGGIKPADNLKDILSNNETQGRVIILGYGGGVTGEVTTYKIYEDGSLFENNSLIANEPQKKLKVLSNAKAIQNQFDALNLDAITLDAAGNMYFFVGYEEDGKTHRCNWGAIDTEVPENLKSFYDNTMDIISENQK